MKAGASKDLIPMQTMDPSKRRVLVPMKDARSVSIFRCTGCGKMNTDLSVEMFGECWYCGGHKLCGGSPGIFETLALWAWLDVVFFKLVKSSRRRKGGAQ
jgi:hypothetical protein